MNEWGQIQLKGFLPKNSDSDLFIYLHDLQPKYILLLKKKITPMDGQSSTTGWSPNLPWMVTQPPLEGHLSSLGWSPFIQNMVPHLLKDCYPASKGWSLGGLKKIESWI